MKTGIHPEYRPVVFVDTSTDFKFLSGSTKSSSETIKWEDGNEYPLLRVEISSDSHPFYTGKQKHATADGRVDRFNKNTVSNKTVCNERNNLRTQLLLGVFLWNYFSELLKIKTFLSRVYFSCEVAYNITNYFFMSRY